MYKIRRQDFPQILAILLACLAGLSWGLTFSWPSPSTEILTSKNSTYIVTQEEASYFGVIPPIISIFVSHPCSMLVDILGRKKTLLLTAVPHVLCWILIIISNSIWTLYASRICVGFADAITFATLPVYIGEVATPPIRGSWGNAMTFLIFLGCVLMNSIGPFCSTTVTACIFICIPIIFATTFIHMPESPYFLITKGRIEEARTSLKWLRKRENVEEELAEISKAIKRQMSEDGTFKDLFCTSINRKALIVGVFLRFTQQFSGIAGFQVYCQRLFIEAGGNLSPTISAILFTTVLAFGSLWASIFVDIIGRRKSMISSGIACVTVLFLMGIYLHLKTFFDLSLFTWFPIVGMIFFIISFSLGLGLVPNLMLGELFSNSIKSKALTIHMCAFAAFQAGTTKIFQVFMSEFGLYSSFYFYMGSCLFGTIVCSIIMPETKGKTLDEIQLGFQKKTKHQHKTSVPT